MGVKAAVQKTTGGVPPVKINALKTTIAQQLKKRPTVAKYLENVEEMLMLFDNFWRAVENGVPQFLE